MFRPNYSYKTQELRDPEKKHKMDGTEPATVRDLLKKVGFILCPTFCPRITPPKPKKKKNDTCRLSKNELKSIYKHLELDAEDGILPYKLHCAWEGFMTQELFDIWSVYIFGSKDDIVPDQKKFCELVKGQWFGPLDMKVRTVLAIVMQKNYKEIKKGNLKTSSQAIINYFYNMMATYIKGMSYINNPQFLKWVRRNADLRENNLHIASDFFKEKLPEMVGEQDLYTFMKAYPIFRDILTSVIELCFGISSIYDSIIPLPKSSSQTILDISQIVLLNSFVRDSYEHYEWELLYSTSDEGFYDTYFFQHILHKGPTVLVIQDEEGWIFGGFAPRSWKIYSDFFGDARCFLFRLEPTFAVYPSSGENGNYQYLNDFPHHVHGLNGLAMGGSLGSFGLWVSLDRNVGRCGDSCITFQGYKRLSYHVNFHFSHLEFWRVSRRVLDPSKLESRSMMRLKRPRPERSSYFI